MVRSSFLGCLLLVAPALAQNNPPQQPPRPPQNLGEALAQTYWNAEQRGPLLAIAPERVATRERLVLQIAPVKTPPLPPQNGYNALDISAYFDHQPFRVGGVTIVAPKTMRLFTRPTMSPELAVPLSRDEAALELLTSLTSAQWQRLGAESGLGLSDLTEKQKPSFLALLPPRVALVPSGPSETPPREQVTLNETQRLGMRMRLARRIRVLYMMEGKNNNLISFGEDNPDQRYFFNDDLLNQDHLNPLPARLYPEVSNRLKQGELDFANARLDARVSLTELKTLGELLARIGTATRLTLLADYRVRNLPLMLRGESARSGDLLQALCLGVSGAFRRLDNTTFLLTEDKEGLTTRQAAYDLWMERVVALRQQKQEERIKKIKANGGTLPTDNPDGLSAEVLKKIQDPYRPTPPGEEPGIPTSALPPSLQKRAEEVGKNEVTIGDEAGGTTKATIRTDRVQLQVEPEALWVVPGYGSFPNRLLNIGWSLAGMLQPQEAPPEPPPSTGPLFALAWKERILVLAPQSPAEASEAVVLAKQAGLKTLWVVVPQERDQARSVLEAAVAAGKAAGVAIGAQLSALAPLSESNLLDRTPLGEPFGSTASVFNLAPTTSTAQFLTERLRAIAAVPGVSAVSFSATFSSYQRDQYLPTHQTLGYLPENRAAFLKQTGNDIFDMPTRQYTSYPVGLGYFSKTQAEYILLPGGNGNYGPDPSFRDMSKEWQSFRLKQLQSFLATLDTTLTALPCPCFTTLGTPGLIGLWKLPDLTKPSSYTGQGDYEQFMLNQARKRSSTVLRSYSPWAKATPKELLAWLRRLAEQDTKPQHADGIVLNCSQLSLAEARDFLALLKSPPGP